MAIFTTADSHFVAFVTNFHDGPIVAAVWLVNVPRVRIAGRTVRESDQKRDRQQEKQKLLYQHVGNTIEGWFIGILSYSCQWFGVKFYYLYYY